MRRRPPRPAALFPHYSRQKGIPLKTSRISEGILEHALSALTAWENDGVSLDDCLDDLRAGDFPAKAAVASLLFEYFRHKHFLDSLLIKHARKGKVNQQMRLLVSLAAAQVFFQTGLPWQSAVNIAVDTAKKLRGPGGGAFVNAILRAYVRDASVDRANIPADCPPLLTERWTEAYGPEQAASILGQFASNPPISVRLRPGADASLLAACEPEPFDPDFDTGDFRFFSLKSSTGLFDNPLLQDGSVYVQDPATCMGLGLLDSRPSGAILDLCAAPGGKTIMLSEVAAPNAKITAADRSARRVSTLNLNLRRAGVKAKTLAADARELPFPPQSFDFILADVPCSNTGVIRRRPDVPWRFSKKRLGELAVLQHAILKNAVSLLRPGGILLYSTCSLEIEENMGRVQLILSEFPGLSLLRERTLFPTAAHDGAFSAVLTQQAVL